MKAEQELKTMYGYIAWHPTDFFIQGMVNVYATFSEAEELLEDVFGHSYGCKGWRVRQVKVSTIEGW